MLPLTPIDLQRLRNRKRLLVDSDSLFANKPFPPGSGTIPPEQIEHQRAVTALTVASALAVVVSFGALIAVEVFIPV